MEGRPHRPTRAGSGADDSVIYVAYRPSQVLSEFVVTYEEVVVCVQCGGGGGDGESLHTGMRQARTRRWRCGGSGGGGESLHTGTSDLKGTEEPDGAFGGGGPP